MFELLAFWNFFESNLIREVLCEGYSNDSIKVERTIIYNSKNGKLYDYDSFKEKHVLKEQTKYVSDDFLGLVGYSGTYTTESIFVGNNLNVKQIQTLKEGNLFGVPIQGESTEIIKIINAKNNSSNYEAKYSITGYGIGTTDAKANLSCKLIGTYSF